MASLLQHFYLAVYFHLLYFASLQKYWLYGTGSYSAMDISSAVQFK
jgi:hypothetical protein